MPRKDSENRESIGADCEYRETDRWSSRPFITSNSFWMRLQLVEPSIAAFATSRLLLNGLHLIEDGFEVLLLAITGICASSISRAHGRQQGAELLVLGIALVSLGQLFSFCYRGSASARSTGRGSTTWVTTSVFSARASSALASSILPLSASRAADLIAAGYVAMGRLSVRSRSLARLATMAGPFTRHHPTTPETTTAFFTDSTLAWIS